MPLRTLFIDLNSFFASCEQQLRPELRGRPVAVVPMLDVNTTACLAASYEAKKFGVRTGTLVGEAKRLCPGLVCVKSSHTVYIEFHHKVLAAAETVLPVAGVHSIDEFSCRLMGTEQQRPRAEELARAMKRAIKAQVGECMTCSIGIAPNRLLAKMGSDMQKPDGLVVLDDANLRERLERLTPRDIPGVGAKMEARLKLAGVTTMAQLLACDARRMTELWGSVVGGQYFAALRGEDTHERATTKRSIGHQHVLGPEKRNDDDARAICVRLLDKAAARARDLGYWARRLTLHVKFVHPIDALGGARDFVAHESFDEAHDILTLLHILGRLWEKKPHGTPLRVGVTLDELRSGIGATSPLFEGERKNERIASAIDAINQKLGKAAVYPASMQRAKKSAPARIAFHAIPDLNLPHVKESKAIEDELDRLDRDKPTGSRPG